MKKQKLIDAIVEIAEEQGFSVDIEKQGDNAEFTFSQYTDAGQDFSFSVVMEGYDIGTLIRDIYDYYVSYDVDENAYMWVDSSGHGKNGAPYHLSDIIEDMKQCEKMILDLHDAILDANREKELWKLCKK